MNEKMTKTRITLLLSTNLKHLHMATPILLPGDVLSQDQLPSSSKSSRTLTVGPGISFSPPSTLEVSTSGIVSVDNRKNTVWIENNGGGKYQPAVGDRVIATVHHSSVDDWFCTLATHSQQATLNHLAFEGVTRKTRPLLQSGSIVYARVSRVGKYLDVGLECINPSTGKADGLGELVGGTLFDISLGMSRRLLMSKSREQGRVIIFEELGAQGLHFEVATGRNGKVWINSDNIQTTIKVGQLIRTTDRSNLTIEEQEKMIKRVT